VAIKEYTNGEITVVWNSPQCIHSANCLSGLPQVFNLSRTPWVNMQGAGSPEIISAVRNCPSGALSIKTPHQEGAKKQMTDVKIKLVANGPLLVNGSCRIIDEQGKETAKDEQFSLCRCGGSSRKPFCDGTHRKNGFTSRGNP